MMTKRSSNLPHINRVRRVCAGRYSVETAAGTFTVNYIEKRDWGINDWCQGGWFVTQPGAMRADDVYPTLWEAKEAINGQLAEAQLCR